MALEGAGTAGRLLTGWSPSRSHPNAKERLLKAEYIFAPYRPGQAVLTGGDIDFSGSVAVNAVGGLAADVHTNSNIMGANNSLSVSGAITASGTVASCPSGVAGGCTASQPPERDSGGQPSRRLHRLCPDDRSVVRPLQRRHRASPLVSGPCTGTQISASPYRSWYWTAGNATTPGMWTLQNTGTSYPGVYYVYGANAEVGANGNSNVDSDGVCAR